MTIITTSFVMATKTRKRLVARRTRKALIAEVAGREVLRADGVLHQRIDAFMSGLPFVAAVADDTLLDLGARVRAGPGAGQGCVGH